MTRFFVARASRRAASTFMSTYGNSTTPDRAATAGSDQLESAFISSHECLFFHVARRHTLPSH
jgi:hypothetical protein